MNVQKGHILQFNQKDIIYASLVVKIVKHVMKKKLIMI